MATLSGNTIASTFSELLRLGNSTLSASAGTSHYIKDAADTNSALSINTTRVGIGTSSPGALLDIKATDSTTCLILRDQDSAGDSNYIELYESNDDKAWELRKFNDVADSDADAGIGFRNAANANVLALTQAGDVGIGTNAPDNLLEVSSTNAIAVSQSTVGDNTVGGVHIANLSETNGHGSMLKFSTRDGANTVASAIAHIQLNSTSGRLAFYTESGGSIAEQMTILNTGFVGIGLAAPAHHLHVETSVDSAYVAKIKNTSSTNSYGLMIDTAANTGSGEYILNCTTGAGTGFFVTSEAEVGIGTNAPAELLHLAAAEPYLRFDGTHADGDYAIGTADGNLYFTDTSTAVPTMTINDANVGIGETAPICSLEIGDTDDTLSFQIFNLHGSIASTLQKTVTARPANAAWNYIYFQSDGESGPGEFYVNGLGNTYCNGAAIAGDTADYAEFFESSDGNAISIGTTVVLENGKVRPASSGEVPFGAVSVTIGNGVAWSYWSNRYLKDDYKVNLWEDDPAIKDRSALQAHDDGKRRVENPDYDESMEYVSREYRDEWNSIGLLGQVPITKGQPVAPSWIKMWEVSNSVDMYYIFPCAQVINNNQQGDSSNEQEQQSAGSGDSGGDASSESSGQDSGGVEADSSDSSDSASGASEASESSSDDGDESSGSSGSDSSDDSEGGSGADDSEGIYPDGEPSAEWTKDQLKEYMIDNVIAFNSGDTKQDLLDKITLAGESPDED